MINDHWSSSRSINLANLSYPHHHHHYRPHHHHHHDHHYHYQNQHELLLLSAHWATDWIDFNSDVSLYNVYIVRINLFLIQGSLSSSNPGIKRNLSYSWNPKIFFFTLTCYIFPAPGYLTKRISGPIQNRLKEDLTDGRARFQQQIVSQTWDLSELWSRRRLGRYRNTDPHDGNVRDDADRSCVG